MDQNFIKKILWVDIYNLSNLKNAGHYQRHYTFRGSKKT